MNQKLLLLGAIALILVGAGSYVLGTKKSQPAVENKIVSQPSPTPTSEKSNLTPDQIFSEAALQLSLNRSQLNYFRIFGEDKIQYSLGSGTNFAYKYEGKWQIVTGIDTQGIGPCNDLSNVPEQYRPICYDSTTGQEKYMDSQRQSLNYPPSQMISYIGE